jgi:predicted 2-oxoglutarate/Fe(II)-dependent dioxygenase YbiX
VALNDESEYEGGRLVYATDEGLVCPSRRAGSATLHNSFIAHGVSLHTRGVRYSLFFLQVPTSTGSAVHGLESTGG